MKKEVYFIRHGQTEFNVLHIVQGRGVDSSLNDMGRKQAKAFYKAYANISFDQIITSTLKRTRETVSPFLETNTAIHSSYEEIDEISWGIYEGRSTNPALHKSYKQLIADWGKGHYDYRIPEGDSALDMHARLDRFVQKLRALEAERVLVCTHGGTLAFLMAMLQEEPISAMVKYRHQNTGLCKFVYDGHQFHLRIQDDVSHLSDLI
ncbi:MAG: histidine phosphatase family protein [Saprospiraceae bacterium]|nr:histidine phosphatase family protein [Saprospiraceae bacterium]